MFSHKTHKIFKRNFPRKLTFYIKPKYSLVFLAQEKNFPVNISSRTSIILVDFLFQRRPHEGRSCLASRDQLCLQLQCGCRPAGAIDRGYALLSDCDKFWDMKGNFLIQMKYRKRTLKCQILQRKLHILGSSKKLHVLMISHPQ